MHLEWFVSLLVDPLKNASNQIQMSISSDKLRVKYEELLQKGNVYQIHIEKLLQQIRDLVLYFGSMFFGNAKNLVSSSR